MAGPEVTMELFGGLPIRDNSGEALTPISWLVTGLAPQDNPLDVTGVPQTGSLLTIRGVEYRCDKIDTPKQISRSAFRVQTYFSTDARYEVLVRSNLEDKRNFKLGYKKVNVTAPFFKRVSETVTQSNGVDIVRKKWVREDMAFPLEWRTLNISVKIENVDSDSQILAIIAQTELQEGRIHIFPYNPQKLWRMLPCGIDRQGSNIEIAYAWESDPGNGPMEMPPLPGVLFTDKIEAGQRSPFHIYNVMPPEDGDTDQRPRIWSVNLFRVTNNPYYQPNGYIGLPGNPI